MICIPTIHYVLLIENIKIIAHLFYCFYNIVRFSREGKSRSRSGSRDRSRSRSRSRSPRKRSRSRSRSPRRRGSRSRSGSRDKSRSKSKRLVLGGTKKPFTLFRYIVCYWILPIYVFFGHDKAAFSQQIKRTVKGAGTGWKPGYLFINLSCVSCPILFLIRFYHA